MENIFFLNRNYGEQGEIMKRIQILVHFSLALLLASCVGNTVSRSTNSELVKQIPIEDFFRKPQQSGYRLSPDGKYYVYRAPVDGINNIFLQEIGKAEPIQLTHSTDRDIMRFYWGTENEILYLQDSEGDENYKLYRLNIRSKEIECLTDFENANTTIIDFFAKNPNEIIIGLNKRNPECSDVYRLNIKTGKLRMVEQNPGHVRSWMVDNGGVVRIAYAGDVLYRKDERSKFKKLIDNEGEDDTFTIH